VILPCTPQSDTNRPRPRTTAGWRRGVPRNGAPRLADCNFTVRRDKSFADDLVERPGRVRSRVALLLRATERKPDAALICDSPEFRASWGLGDAGPRGRCVRPRGAASSSDRPGNRPLTGGRATGTARPLRPLEAGGRLREGRCLARPPLARRRFANRHGIPTSRCGRTLARRGRAKAFASGCHPARARPTGRPAG
jgi:hypothetical protein